MGRYKVYVTDTVDGNKIDEFEGDGIYVNVCDGGHANCVFKCNGLNGVQVIAWLASVYSDLAEVRDEHPELSYFIKKFIEDED
jgi:hypothetical protein